MKSAVETLTPTRVKLTVEVPFEELKPSLDAAYSSIGAQINVPGFRKGKVPARIIDQRVGRGAVLQEAVNDALPRLYGEAAREHELQPLGQPDIDITNLDDGTSLSFTAEVDVRPEVPVPDLDGVAVTVDDAQVTDADVDEQVDELRQRFGTLKSVDRPAEEGAHVSLDLVSRIGGEEVDGGSATGLSYQVGSDDLVDGLDDAITGASAGDSVTFTSTLRQGEHAGQDADITATVTAVKLNELPEADDVFAQMASEFDTIGELREDLRERLGRVRLLEQGADARDRLLEQLIETVEFPVPESAITAEVDYRRHDIVHQLNHDDELFDRYLQSQGTTREDFDADLRTNAEKSVRAQFILDAIAAKSDVQIGDAELTEYLVRQAQQYQMSPQDFAKQVMDAGNLPMLVADIRRNKALAQVLQAAVITDASGNPVDLAALDRLAEEADTADAVDEDAAVAEADALDGDEDDDDADAASGVAGHGVADEGSVTP